MIREAVGAIIHQGDAYIVVCKSWQHTLNGEMKINDEWDIVKGGVEKKRSIVGSGYFARAL